MRRFFVGCLAIFGFLCLLFIAVLGVGTYFLVSNFAPQETADMQDIEDAVLLADLRGPIMDGPEQDPFVAALSQSSAINLQQFTLALDNAKTDSAIKALVVRLGGDSTDLATAQALHRAIEDFAQSGKPVIAHANSFGEFGNGTFSYMIASAADTIALQEGGTLGITGLHASVPFAADTLALVGATAEFGRRGEYKTAPETGTERDMSPAHREMLESLTGDLYAQITTAITNGRQIDQPTLDGLIDQAPLDTNTAIEAGLIDTLTAWQNVDDLLQPNGATSEDLLHIEDYAGMADIQALEAETRAAIIYASGIILEGEAPSSPFESDRQIAADSLARTITNAVDDDDFAGIILRINSGGGSAIASEVIAQAIDYARENEKPVIISMGGAAASGGYWISAPASAIIAEGGTITGSIGVFAGKLVFEDLWDRIGLNWRSVNQGQNAGMFTPNERFTNSQRAILESFLDSIYEQFLVRVAEGRNLPVDVVREAAEGRVWTGAQAAKLGLVDRLGGLETALDELAIQLALPEDEKIAPITYPEPEELIDRVLDLAGGDSGFPLIGTATLPPALQELTKALDMQRSAEMPALSINGFQY